MKVKEKVIPNDTELRATFVPFGHCFSHSQNSTPIFCRLKVTGFLLNSTVLSDIINRGDLIVHNLNKGTVHGFNGDTPVVLRNASVVLEDD